MFKEVINHLPVKTCNEEHLHCCFCGFHVVNEDGKYRCDVCKKCFSVVIEE